MSQQFHWKRFPWSIHSLKRWLIKSLQMHGHMVVYPYLFQCNFLWKNCMQSHCPFIAVAHDMPRFILSLVIGIQNVVC